MILPDEVKNKIVENNKKITELLHENEVVFRKAGFNPPVDNYALARFEKIGFPSGYIRTVTAFNTKYHLYEICPDRATRHNITYALETSDLINFVINRMNIWGSVETIFFKIAIVNLVSIIEAIVLEATNNICCNAGNCGKTKTCCYHFSKNERNNARKAVEKLTAVEILDFDIKKVSRVQEIIDLRNRIHIRLSKVNEMKMDDFTLELYNEVVTLLQDVDNQIYKKAVPHYGCK